jgi:hypothetical protein
MTFSATNLLLPYPVELACEKSSLVEGINAGGNVLIAAAMEEQKINFAGSGPDVVNKESTNKF